MQKISGFEDVLENSKFVVKIIKEKIGEKILD
jgi:hypothetical protein